ncbi:hypothetical protein SPBR_04912 [Sporothrix brasiliensis 5110]|uniref:Uncharacterized protein n=1 Tax=Sporothrix brasiliensis 5110 TaxID=1398154 RepID=A0A0C2IQ08_9PEZI|nr:uncharacterized protein SPBR_04912 [Sporothrix brasiliensis 5110]KIH87122.1 hypothetical protein SPBR_04912 [Sporothrix brasiliensis 5110]
MPGSLRDRHRDREDNGNDSNDSNIEHIIRRVLALALHKFDNGGDTNRESSRDDRPPADRGAGDSDLAKLVLGQVVQFGIRRYLKSREKKRATAAKATSKANMRIPRFSLPGAQPGSPPGPVQADRGLAERGLREGNFDGGPNQYYPLQQQQQHPYPPPPHQHHRRRDDLEDRRYERRERYERRLERERLEQLERERLRGGDRPGRSEGMHQTRHPHQSPSDRAPSSEQPRLRRVPRTPLPKSYPTSSFPEAREPLRDWGEQGEEQQQQQQQQQQQPPSQPPRDVAREQRAYQRRQESFGATPRPFPADLLGSGPGPGRGGRYRYARLPSQVDDDAVPHPHPHPPPPPQPFSWESVPIYPPPAPRATKRQAPESRPAAARPADLPTPPISPQKTPAATDRQAAPADVHAHVRRALDDLLVQLRRTDSVVYRAMYRPPVVGDHHRLHRHHHHSHERGQLLFHAADLQRSIAQTKAEIRGLQGVLGMASRDGPERGGPEGDEPDGRREGRDRGKEARRGREQGRDQGRDKRREKQVTMQVPGEKGTDGQ